MASVTSGPITATIEEIPSWEAIPERSLYVIESPPMVAGLAMYRLTIDQYRRMADQGIIDSKSKVHLIDGLLVAKMTKYPPHIIASNNLDYFLNRRLPEGWHLSIQNPIQVPPSPSLPEPDVVVLRGLPSDYEGRIAAPADILLVIEVSDSSLRADQKTMKRLYAQANVSEYWIVNLIDCRIEVYTGPTGPGASPDYRQRRLYEAGEIVPVRIDGQEVAQLTVDEILPLPPKP